MPHTPTSPPPLARVLDVQARLGATIGGLADASRALTNAILLHSSARSTPDEVRAAPDYVEALARFNAAFDDVYPSLAFAEEFAACLPKSARLDDEAQAVSDAVDDLLASAGLVRHLASHGLDEHGVSRATGYLLNADHAVTSEARCVQRSVSSLTTSLSPQRLRDVAAALGTMLFANHDLAHEVRREAVAI